MEIRFRKQGTTVMADVTVNIPNWDARVFSFAFECGQEAYAGLLTDAMQRQTADEIEAIRKDEYESGWRDKAAHKGGMRNWFASTFKWRNRR